MAEITPAILPKNYEELKNKAAMVRKLVPLVQVDICDGAYVSGRTWPFSSGKELDPHFMKILREEEGLPFWEDLDYELDLMVMDAVENFDVYAKLGAGSLIFHLGAVGDLKEFREFLEGIDPYIRDSVRIGVAIDLDFLVEDFFPLAGRADFAQVMGNSRIGIQGENLDRRSLEYVKSIKKKFPDLPVSVDIGVNLDTVHEILAAGADRLVAGSAIFDSGDIIRTIEEFRNLA